MMTGVTWVLKALAACWIVVGLRRQVLEAGPSEKT